MEKSEATGDWGVPAWTFAATQLAVLHAGVAHKVLDARPDGRIDPASHAGPILEVWPWGAGPSDLILDLDRPHLIDGAASFDALRGIGSYLDPNHAVVLSLHPMKVLVGGEGGIFLSKDVDWVRRVRQWSQFGFGPERKVQKIGTNAKMAEPAAAIALASLDEWNRTRRDWLELKSWATEAAMSRKIRCNLTENDFAVNYFICSFESADDMSKILLRHGIAAKKWWNPMAEKDFLKESTVGSSFPITKALYETSLGLPFYLGMDRDLFSNRLDSALRDYAKYRSG